jgi:diguanylate cyclase (GGDEF)-like protein
MRSDGKIDLPDSLKPGKDRLGLILQALRDPYSYNPLNNGYFWIGFLWGLPIPLFFLWFHSGLASGSIMELFEQAPVHFVFALHPILFGVVFGLAGSVAQHYLSRIQEESVRDYLTGLYNHRFFREELSKRIHEAERYDRTLGLILFDLDHFKRVNDEYGHQIGDRVLKEFGNLLQETTRSSDIVFRYGGEEFAIILPEAELEDARQLADRIREDVAIHDFGIDRQITVSGGVAEYPSDSNDEMNLIQIVDERLYEAKGAGRNMIVANEEVGTSNRKFSGSSDGGQ